MKKQILTTIIILFMFLFTANIYSQSDLSFVRSKTVKVSVSVAYLKSAPNSFGKNILELKKGTSMKVIEIKDPWLKVSVNNTEGWINKSAFSDKKSFSSYKGVVKMEISTTTAAARSITLAMSSGFNLEIYNAYMESKKELNFKSLDEIEKSQSESDPLKKYESFRRTGKLGEYK